MGLLRDGDGRNKNAERRTDIHKEFLLARRPTYLKIHLDNILHNLEIIRSRIANHTKIIAIVKGNAYGHGSIPISRFLQQHGVQHFAVATALEGEELRQAGIDGYIQVLGNGSFEEIPTLYANELTPTVATTEFLHEWAEFINDQQEIKGNPRDVVIKIDTGMSRNGCKPEKFPDLLEVCDHHNIPIHSIMTHFAQSWDDPAFTKHQLKLFIETVRLHRYRGFKLHVANSGAINNNIGVDLDFVRPGISLYGQPPDTSDFCSSLSISMGYRPAISWIARPSLVKQLQPGDVVGYDKTYTCENQETVATFAVGYSDGYHRNLFKQGYLTTPTGIKCPLVGRVSMDSITVRLPEDITELGTFYLMTSDTNDVNSSFAISRKCKTIPYEGNPRDVVIKIDTGMSRNGCKPEKFPDLLEVCDHHNIPIHSIMTHFAQSWDDPAFTKHQLKLFIETVRLHRYRDFKLHVANSGAINNNIGVDLDFVRPGISLYGQPPDTSDFCSSLSISMGYRPAISWIARPSLVKQLQPGDVVGYDKTYTCENQETVATFAVGYSDGYHRNLFKQSYLTTPTVIKRPLVGRVSMDSITARLPEDITELGTFYLMTSDTNDVNSSFAISRKCKTIPYEVCTDLDKRLPRLYETDGKVTNDICST